jgi:HlyD family secretion protein
MVYVDDAGTARLREVKVGVRSGTAAEILEGLAAGERVVVFPDDRVADGVRIVPVQADAR